MDNQLEIRFPNKFDDKYRIGYVYFDDVDKREKYIREEFMFCNIEEKAYLSALYSNQRTVAIQNLYNKRIDYARVNSLTIDMSRV